MLASLELIELNGQACILTSAQDVTERKQAERASKNSEIRFRSLIENGVDHISLLAADGALLWESPAVEGTLGYAPDEFLGRPMFEIIHPDDLAWIHATLARLTAEPGIRRARFIPPPTSRCDLGLG